ncbi:hypothetical protein [Aliagarivorans marinus]|uniref:hypothetical protein n=1 Tax=Aliagarivorans marinus TaxID=561965 RepID=UPI000425289E|nr:hypothetical protein [Aliagarivorans marinus]
MERQLTLAQIQSRLLSQDFTQLPFSDLLQNISDDPQLQQFAPDGICQIDPRNGTLVIYNSARAKRIHTTASPNPNNLVDCACPICDGHVGDILDYAEHSEGFTFVNKNLYPIFLPIDELPCESADYFEHQDPEHRGRSSYGFHLLQWTSSIHTRDWHNMPFGDALISFQRLAAIEHSLLHQPSEFMSRSMIQMAQQSVSGYVSVIKNYGAAAGASLTHGHQQIGYSNILPQQFFNNLRFRKRNDKPFSQFILEENPKELQVWDFGEVLLVVPYFMKRPFDMLLLVKDTEVRYLHQLSDKQQQQVVKAIQAVCASLIALMQQMGKVPAFNFMVNNGPGCGLYIEFLAKTQLMGGFEQIGLYVCQANPKACAEELRTQIAQQLNSG